MNLSTSNQEALLSGEACWSLLERVAASSQMKKAGRLRNLLLYVGRRSLKEGCLEVHEKEIGVEVFGRQETYDTSVDNIVRSNVSDLRKRIDRYFSTEGLTEPVIMEIPRGSYLPVFRLRPIAPASMADSSIDIDSVIRNGHQTLTAVSPVSAPRAGAATRFVMFGLSIACLVLAIGCVSLWILNREMQRAFYPWKYQPAVASLWSDFLNSTPETDVVLPDMGFLLIQRISNKPFSFNAYFNHLYMSQLQDLSPDKRADLSQIDARSLGAANGFNLALRFLALDPLHKNIQLYSARDYMPDLLKRDNLILIGGLTANPWVELFQNRMNFTVSTDIGSISIPNTDTSSSTITNRSPMGNEQPTYTRSDSVEYCVVAYLPNPDSNGKVILIQGTVQEATEACGEFLLSEDQLANFQKMLHLTKLPYFEVLLKTSQVKDTPLTSSIEAYRVYPNGPR
jgi:hypothetical protein